MLRRLSTWRFPDLPARAMKREVSFLEWLSLPENEEGLRDDARRDCVRAAANATVQIGESF